MHRNICFVPGASILKVLQNYRHFMSVLKRYEFQLVPLLFKTASHVSFNTRIVLTHSGRDRIESWVRSGFLFDQQPVELDFTLLCSYLFASFIL